jgi:hypothetical protein
MLQHYVVNALGKPRHRSKMALAFRYYLFPESVPQRLSKKLLEGLIRGRERMPQFAGTKQRTAEIILELEDRRPIRIVRATGSYFHFDHDGALHFLADAAVNLLDTHRALENAKNAPPSKVVDLAPLLNRRKVEREHRWELSTEQLDLIVKDIWRPALGPK